jgi:hypothetical protein
MLGMQERMKRLVISVLKGVGIAALYAAVAALLCATASACLWEPFYRRYDGGNSSNAWPAFVGYYRLLLNILTGVTALLAGRSYRPPKSLGGVATGLLAALDFRLVEWWATYNPGRVPPSLSLTIQAACLFGLIFGFLGSLSVKRRPAQPNAPTKGGPAVAFGSLRVSGGPPSVS